MLQIFRSEPRIKLNYIWIGPPPKDKAQADLKTESAAVDKHPMKTAAAGAGPAAAAGAGPAAGAGAPAAAGAGASAASAGAGPAAAGAAASSAAGPATNQSKDTTASGILGHDTLAPILMSAKINSSTHQILFWCLDEYAETYQKTFNPYPNITVMAIRASLNKHRENPLITNKAAMVIKIMDHLLKPARNQIRDKVTVKNALSFFLAILGDYVLDSNIRPNATVNLPRFDHFHAPAMHLFDGHAVGFDAWMLFSNPNNPSAAIAAFNKFCELFWETETKLYAKTDYSEAYYRQQGKNLVVAVTFAKPTPWPSFPLDESLHDIVIPSLGITKQFFNTHKFAARSYFESKNSLAIYQFFDVTRDALHSLEPSVKQIIFDSLDNSMQNAFASSIKIHDDLIHIEICLAANQNNLQRINELIELGVNVDQQGSAANWRNISALHLSIFNKNAPCTEALLRAGARVDLVATIAGQNCTALDMIHAIKEPTIKNQFIALYDKYHPKDVKHKPSP